MNHRKTGLRAAAVSSIAVCLLAATAVSAQAQTKSGYKYCSGGTYVVSLFTVSGSTTKHVHKTGNGTKTFGSAARMGDN